jgi:hypothetical protein
MEPGTGKTKVLLMVGGELWLLGLIDAIIVAAPNGVHTQWVAEEAPKDMPVNVPWRGFAWKRATSKVRHARMAKIASPDPSSLLIVTFNFESMVTDTGSTTLEWFLRKYRCLLVVDESSRIRNPGTERTKLLLKVRDLAPIRAALTGTPNPKGYENLWSQFQFLEPSILDCPTYTSFKNQYCQLAPIPGVRFGTRIIGYRQVDTLLGKLKQHVFTKRKSECLDLPGVLPPITRKLQMTPEQKNAYNSMKDQHILELERCAETGEERYVMVQRVIAARSKLRQIAIGFILDENGKANWITHHRLKRIVENLEDSDDKLILWCPFNAPKYEFRSLLDKHKIPFMLDESPGAQTEFNNSTLRVLLAHPQRSGIGFNMANCERHIWLGPIDDEELRIQGTDRTNRIGQKVALTTETYAAPGTVEMGMLARGIDKKQMLDMVMSRQWRELLSGPEEDDADWSGNDNYLITPSQAAAELKTCGLDSELVDHWLAHDDLKSLRKAVKQHLPHRFMSDAEI